MTDVSPWKILATVIFTTWMNTQFYHKKLFSAKLKEAKCTVEREVFQSLYLYMNRLKDRKARHYPSLQRSEFDATTLYHEYKTFSMHNTYQCLLLTVQDVGVSAQNKIDYYWFFKRISCIKSLRDNLTFIELASRSQRKMLLTNIMQLCLKLRFSMEKGRVHAH